MQGVQAAVYVAWQAGSMHRSAGSGICEHGRQKQYCKKLEGAAYVSMSRRRVHTGVEAAAYVSMAGRKR
jgi:hypothetical protein